MITTRRLTTALSVVDHWPFFMEGLETVGSKCKETVDSEIIFKIFCTLATNQTSGWVGIVFVDGKPQGFGVMQETTPLFSPERIFAARMFWHKTGNQEASVCLMNAFEHWARANNIKRYIITTRRDSGAAIRCFQSNKFGFKKGYVTYEKEL